MFSFRPALMLTQFARSFQRQINISNTSAPNLSSTRWGNPEKWSLSDNWAGDAICWWARQRSSQLGILYSSSATCCQSHLVTRRVESRRVLQVPGNLISAWVIISLEFSFDRPLWCGARSILGPRDNPCQRLLSLSLDTFASTESPQKCWWRIFTR